MSPALGDNGWIVLELCYVVLASILSILKLIAFKLYDFEIEILPTLFLEYHFKWRSLFVRIYLMAYAFRAYG